MQDTFSFYLFCLRHLFLLNLVANRCLAALSVALLTYQSAGAQVEVRERRFGLNHVSTAASLHEVASTSRAVWST